MNHARWKFLPVLVGLFACGVSHADTQKPPRAARSIHLGYDAPQASAFYNEVTVRQSTRGSFFMVCGCNRGYFGIQEASNGRKWALFSIWDPAPPKGTKVPVEDQVQVPYQADDVRVKRFGGEGTGGQCFFDYDWKLGETYRFLVKTQVETDPERKLKRTSYAAWFFVPEGSAWKHLVTFKTITKGQQLEGLYSFIEDFRRDTKSATEVRRAAFGNGWVEDLKGDWTPLRRARFDASDAVWEAKDTIDAGLVGAPPIAFFLQTGGDTTLHTPLDSTIEIKRPPSTAHPSDLPAD